MGRPMKKLQKSDIVKNSSIQVSHSIKKIKEHETRYTILLVFLFMVLFCFIGYFTLRVNTDGFFPYQKRNTQPSNGVSLASSVVTLTNENVLQGEDGIATYYLMVDNHSEKDIHYRIVLKEDFDIIPVCGCMHYRVSPSSIHYQIDTVSSFLGEDNILIEDTLAQDAQKRIVVKLWLDPSLDPNVEAHFHGHFVIEEI